MLDTPALLSEMRMSLALTKFPVLLVAPRFDTDEELSLEMFNLFSFKGAGKSCEFQMDSRVETIAFVLLQEIGDDHNIIVCTEPIHMTDFIRSLSSDQQTATCLVKRRFQFSRNQGWCDIHLRFCKLDRPIARNNFIRNEPCFAEPEAIDEDQLRHQTSNRRTQSGRNSERGWQNGGLRKRPPLLTDTLPSHPAQSYEEFSY